MNFHRKLCALMVPVENPGSDLLAAYLLHLTKIVLALVVANPHLLPGLHPKDISNVVYILPGNGDVIFPYLAFVHKKLIHALTLSSGPSH
jgi:hypothetical protein